MHNADHEAERASEHEGAERDRALRAPEHFYPRPEDVLADASLSHDEKIELLRNWQTQLEDRGGALADGARPATTDDTDRAVRDALDRLQAARGG